MSEATIQSFTVDGDNTMIRHEIAWKKTWCENCGDEHSIKETASDVGFTNNNYLARRDIRFWRHLSVAMFALGLALGLWLAG